MAYKDFVMLNLDRKMKVEGHILAKDEIGLQEESKKDREGIKDTYA